MPDALDKLRTGVSKARTKIAAQRLGGREFDVVVEAWTEGNTEAGTIGSWTDSLTLSPRPSVALKAVFRMTDGGPVQVGDALVSRIDRTYTEAQLRGAPGSQPRKWRINAERYAIVSLDTKPLEWIAILAREGE